MKGLFYIYISIAILVSTMWILGGLTNFEALTLLAIWVLIATCQTISSCLINLKKEIETWHLQQDIRKFHDEINKDSKK